LGGADTLERSGWPAFMLPTAPVVPSLLARRRRTSTVPITMALWLYTPALAARPATRYASSISTVCSRRFCHGGPHDGPRGACGDLDAMRARSPDSELALDLKRHENLTRRERHPLSLHVASGVSDVSRQHRRWHRRSDQQSKFCQSPPQCTSFDARPNGQCYGSEPENGWPGNTTKPRAGSLDFMHE
jgi:hypothetical protein